MNPKKTTRRTVKSGTASSGSPRPGAWKKSPGASKPAARAVARKAREEGNARLDRTEGTARSRRAAAGAAKTGAAKTGAAKAGIDRPGMAKTRGGKSDTGVARGRKEKAAAARPQAVQPRLTRAAERDAVTEAQRLEHPVRYAGLPVVVIAGRPNVGKSTLYNRMLRKRRVITDPTPGVTRDPVESVCHLRDSGKPISLIDTGGFKLEREGLDALVVEKSLSSLERADLILFLVDAAQVTPEDEEFAGLLRKWGPKVLLVVNKADSPERDPLVWGHAKWGFDPVLYVSAEHGRNMDELEEAMLARLDFSAVRELEANPHEIRVAIMGKPNTGKSTLLNRLLGEEKSIVSEVAGTTRDVVEGRFEWKGRGIVLLDTAGIRRKAKVTEAVEYYSVNRAIRTVDACDVVILLIDAREGLTDQDKKITAFAAEKGRGVIFVLNKWDAMPDIKNSFEAARDKLRYFFGQMSWAPVLPLSAKEGTGIDKLLNAIVHVHGQLTREVETSRLNRCVSEWIEATPPPVGPRTHFKLRYATQTSVNPLRFVFFVTRPDAVKESYISFLRNKLREELGYDKVPLFVELRASRQASPKGRRSGERG
jgi:GTP-binding protein